MIPEERKVWRWDDAEMMRVSGEGILWKFNLPNPFPLNKIY